MRLVTVITTCRRGRTNRLPPIASRRLPGPPGRRCRAGQGEVTDFGRYFAETALAPEPIALHRLIIAEAGRVPGIGRAFLAKLSPFRQRSDGRIPDPPSPPARSP
ncbi:TetR/AcrR family transcriptional regulator C-terminal domain-containing protein [Actinoplanes sp. NPDC049599]|uniref:TetR/AcrR family transcriptional regulator C-terminal domain-containing protein n=1 Tax=Actinoplanes sp. NPDC049599 TaxID=3363903 RepID=UPI0037AEE82E